jgi:hypothetical protein
MEHVILIDKDGWVDGIVSTQCGFDPKHYPASSYVRVGNDEVHLIKNNQLGIWHNGRAFHKISDSKRLWSKLRSAGYSGDRKSVV